MRITMYLRLFTRCPRISAYICRRRVSTEASGSADVRIKEFSEMPRVKAYPVIGTLLEWAPRAHDAQNMIFERYKQYGPIYREKLVNQDLVFVSDARAVEQCFRQDTGYPNRTSIPPWEAYRKEANEDVGILMAFSEDWARMRKVMDKILLKPQRVAFHAKDLNSIAAELCDRFKKIRGEELIVEDLDTELFNWALESVSIVLYEKRLGCLNDVRSPETSKFIDAVNMMFHTSAKLMVPMIINRTLMRKVYKQHNECWDTIFRVARQCTEEKMEQIKNRKIEDGEEQEVGILEHLLASPSFTPKQVLANITDLMTAGVDTTSNSINFTLYELSKNQDIQQKVYEEIQQHIRDFNNITAKDLNNMHYLKACIKETLRMYPIGHLVTRVFEKDIVLLGYRIPTGIQIGFSTYNMGRTEENFENPLKYDPDRWKRDERSRSKPNNFAYVPFGFGTRMCLGRRLAELEMQLLLCQLFHRFKLLPVDDKPIRIKSRLVLFPHDPIRLKFVDRK